MILLKLIYFLLVILNSLNIMLGISVQIMAGRSFVFNRSQIKSNWEYYQKFYPNITEIINWMTKEKYEERCNYDDIIKFLNKPELKIMRFLLLNN